VLLLTRWGRGAEMRPLPRTAAEWDACWVGLGLVRCLGPAGDPGAGSRPV